MVHDHVLSLLRFLHVYTTRLACQVGVEGRSDQKRLLECAAARLELPHRHQKIKIKMLPTTGYLYPRCDLSLPQKGELLSTLKSARAKIADAPDPVAFVADVREEVAPLVNALDLFAKEHTELLEVEHIIHDKITDVAAGVPTKTVRNRTCSSKYVLCLAFPSSQYF